MGTVEQVDRSLKDWAETLSLLEQKLSGTGPFVCGSAFTVADIVVGLSVNRWLQAPIERQSLPAVEAYFERLRQRPASRPYVSGTTD